MKVKYLAAILIGIAALGIQQARASDCLPTIGETCTSTLNTPNHALQNTTGPYGTVTVSLNVATQTATITFTANTAAGYFFVDGGAAAVNINSDSFHTNGNPTELVTNDFKQYTAGNEDSFGQFNLVVDNKNSSVHVTSISFTVTNTSSTISWANASDVLTENSRGWDAAAHIFADTGGRGTTGYVAEGAGGGRIPDGGTTVMLLGMALSALGMARRFLRS